MKNHFNDFKGTIPQDIYLRTKAFMSEQVVIYQPKEYVAGLKTTTENYHFIIFQSTPPLTRLGKRQHQFRKGSLIVLEPETDITIPPAKDTLHGKYTSITIKKNFLNEVLFEATGKERVKFRQIENPYSWNLLDSVEKFKYELSNFGEAYPTMIQSITTQLTFELLRDMNTEGISNITRKSEDNTYINKAVDYMQAYYNSNITIEDICKTLHISTCHFQRMFKQHMGQTPYQFLLGIRLDKAKELLKRSQYSTGEVARLCGFVSQSHFSTIFRQIHGVSPSEYKKITRSP